jgi:serine/threonine protein kinase
VKQLKQQKQTWPTVPDFTIQRAIDSGGFADVYLASSSRSSMQHALKVLQERHSSADAIEAFEAEGCFLRKLQHPNIVRCHGTTKTADGRPVIILEHLTGKNLHHHLRHHKSAFTSRPRPDKVLACLLDVANAIDYLRDQHAKAHLDLTPRNVVSQRVALGERMKLIDFGLMEGVSGNEPVAGMTPYTAPEVLDPEPIGLGYRRADIYSLAVLAVEYLAELPDRDDRHIDAAWTKALPSEAVQLLVKAMATNPAQRPANAAEFIVSLEEAIAKASIRRRVTVATAFTLSAIAVGAAATLRRKTQSATARKGRQ